ncbi:hypothetical protein CAAN1_05S02036 [[Candida] anglica]|uniref:Uncharacterized protein n=1 Tax=[Candida] anglica TaxID=148631 RepID=A0ABP0EEG8_9ASCO
MEVSGTRFRSNSGKTGPYRMEWTQRSCELPSIESFQLSTILDNVLKDESNETVEAMKAVASNYKKDLKSEIRRNLSGEQKIQHKNIKVGKLAQQINKKVSRRNRHLQRALIGGTSNSSELDKELTELLRLSSECSTLVHTLGPRLVAIDQKLGENSITKYKWMNKLWGDSNNDNQDNNNNNNKDPIEMYDVDETVSEVNGSHSQIKIQQNIRDPGKQNGKRNGRVIRPPHGDHDAEVNGDSPVEFNEQSFEQFMSSSISKYREKQSKREDKTFFGSQLQDIQLPDEFAEHTPKLLKNQRSFHSPLSSVNLSAKSPATVSQTLQSSHFKKLRINGSPITSSTYSKMKNIPACDCGNPHEEGTNNADPDQDPSPTLKDSLMELSTLILQGNDVYDNTSSGLNTSSEDDGGYLSSDSSDEESHSDNDGTTVTDRTNMYYLSFKSELKSKRHKRKSKKDSSKSKNNNSQYKPENSPTPKHRPSHYTLKPKKSILKFSTNQDSINRVPSPPPPPICGSAQESFPPIVKQSDPSATGLSGKQFHLGFLNEARKQPVLNTVASTTTTVSGTILTLDNDSYEYEGNEIREWHGDTVISDDESDTRSIRSIALLKQLL